MAESKKTKTPEGCVIRSCSCKSDYQDEKYGKGMRVHNNAVKKARCTVCNTEKGD